MVTRRDMIGLAAAGLAGTALESSGAITRSALALRGAMMGGAKKWQNPYVTDGLVAMWDGEWKNEAGVPSAQLADKYWPDIVSGNNIELLNTNSKVFPDWASYGDKFINFNTNVYITNGYKVTFNRTVSANEITFEGVFGASNKTSLSTVRMSLSCSGGGGYVFPYNATSFYVPNSSGGIQGINTSTMPVNARPKSFSFSCKSGAQSACMNGVEFATGTRTYNDRGNIASLYPAAYNAASGRMDGIYWTMRLYSRALTPDEVAANYAVDAARFNI